VPLIPDQQVLIRSERLDALSEASDEMFRLTSCGLAGYCLHEIEHVLGAMIELAHKQVSPFRALPAFVFAPLTLCNVQVPGPGCEGLWIGGVERRFDGRTPSSSGPPDAPAS
jgi:hypothetical protein